MGGVTIMRHFEDTNGDIRAIESGQEFLIQAGWVELTGEELDARLNPPGSIVARKWGEIKSYRDKVKAGGVLVSTKWFHTDDASRVQQLGLVQLGDNLPAGIMWKTMDGTFIEMTQQLAADIFAAVTQLDIDAFANAETHRAAMEASADPENYDYSNGWPSTYLY